MGKGGRAAHEYANHLPREACVTTRRHFLSHSPRVERDEDRRYVIPSAASLEGRRKKKIRRVFLNQESSAKRLRWRKRQKKTACHMLRQTSPFSDADRT